MMRNVLICLYKEYVDIDTFISLNNNYTSLIH